MISPLPPGCAPGVHDALKADAARWATLRYVGVQRGLADDTEPPLELRDCPDCFSTLAVPINERSVHSA